MADLTDQTIQDFRDEIGDDNEAFSQEEIERMWELAGQDFDGLVIVALKRLLTNAVKFIDFTAAQTDEERSQVFEHLKTLIEMREADKRGKKRTTVFVDLGRGRRKVDKPWDWRTRRLW